MGGVLNASDNYGAFADRYAPMVGVSGAGTYRSAVANARNGAWMVVSDGGIVSYCRAPFLGSLGAQKRFEPVVGMTVRF